MNRTYDAPTGTGIVPHPGKENLRYHNHPILVVKEMSFDASHHLYDYDGKCRAMHGHTYKLLVGVKGDCLDEQGFVVDFGDIKTIFKEHIEPRLDHAYLNEQLPPMNTTAENMVFWIFGQFDKYLNENMPRGGASRNVRVEFVKLYETPTSYAEFQRDWLK